MNSAVRGELVALSLKRREGERIFGVVEIKRAWATACRLAGITSLRFHDLRHTAATRLADAGAFTIAAILGHSSIQMSAVTLMRPTSASGEHWRRLLSKLLSKPSKAIKATNLVALIC